MAILITAPHPQEVAQRPPSRVLMAIPDGPPGIAITLGEMVRFAKEYRTDPTLHAIASQLVARLPGHAYTDEVAAVRDFVRNGIRYTADVYDVETVQSPLFTIERGQGDCDDQALLAATLLLILGHEVRFVAWAFTSPSQFEHVYTETRIGTRWVSLETTEAYATLGWRPDTPYPPMIRTV